MSHNGVFRQKINGITTSRFFIRAFGGTSAVLAATSPFLLTPETAIPALAVTIGGTAGSFLLGMSNAKRSSAKSIKRITGSDQTPLRNTDLAKALLGVPFKTQRVLVNHYPYQPPTAQQQLTHVIKAKALGMVSLSVMPPIQSLSNPRMPDQNSRKWETENYFVSSPEGLYVEQVIKPSSLAVWDQAYASVCREFNFPMEESYVQKALPMTNPGNLSLPRNFQELASRVDVQMIADILTNPRNKA